MIILALLGVVAILFGVSSISMKRLADARDELSYIKRTLPEDDESMLNYLAACAETSHLASRLLREAQEPKALQSHEQSDKVIVEPAWYHDSNAKVPHDAIWSLTLKDLSAEKTPGGRFEALRCWTSQGRSFTVLEKMELIKMFTGPYRIEARRLLMLNKGCGQNDDASRTSYKGRRGRASKG